MVEKFIAPLLLVPTVQNYAWGKVGSDSLVARLVGDISEQLPYAELWYGAHQRAPAHVRERNGLSRLDTLITENPIEILGESVVRQFGPNLPFLFKVLSVKEALSIQAHPNRALAQVLNKRNPKEYPDSNHKPEIAIALSPMRLLYGFRTPEQLALVFAENPELVAVLDDQLRSEINSSYAQSDPALVDRIYRAVVQSPEELRANQGVLLLTRLQSIVDKSMQQALVIEVAQRYGPGDVGVLSSYLMNLLELKPGEGIFIDSNIPHAYLSGDLIECMANSDNVVRAGLTPKFKDIETLVSMLSYECGPPQSLSPRADKGAQGLRWYDVPAQEFAVAEISGSHSVAIDLAGSLALIFCLQGSAQIQYSGGALALSTGAASIVPACLRECSVSLGSSSRAFLVKVPRN